MPRRWPVSWLRVSYRTWLSPLELSLSTLTRPGPSKLLSAKEALSNRLIVVKRGFPEPGSSGLDASTRTSLWGQWPTGSSSLQLPNGQRGSRSRKETSDTSMWQSGTMPKNPLSILPRNLNTYRTFNSLYLLFRPSQTDSSSLSSGTKWSWHFGNFQLNVAFSIFSFSERLIQTSNCSSTTTGLSSPMPSKPFLSLLWIPTLMMIQELSLNKSVMLVFYEIEKPMIPHRMPSSSCTSSTVSPD